MTEMIGHGEKVCVELLKEHYGTGVAINTQVPLHTLVSKAWADSFSERQEKETIDIVVYRKDKFPLAVRVQDKHHSTSRMKHIDDAQARLLKWNEVDVLDIWWNENIEIFKDKATHEAYIELEFLLKKKIYK